MQGLYIDKYDPWEKLKQSYNKAKEVFPGSQVGIRCNQDDMRITVVYIIEKDFQLNGIKAVDGFVEVIKESHGFNITRTEKGELEIDVLFEGL